jgi:hypothetical protein
MTDHTNRNNAIFGEIHCLVTSCLEGDATPSISERLERLVCDHPEALDLYIEYLRDSICLRCVPPKENRDQMLPSLADSEANSPCVVFDATPEAVSPHRVAPAVWRGAIGYISSGWPMAYLVATAILVTGLLIGAFTYISQPAEFIVNESNPRSLSPSHVSNAFVVGRVSGMVNCTWRKSEGVVQQDSAVVLGQRIDLFSGLLEICYDTGAKVILEGPVTYEVESANGGFMAVGKLSGKAESEESMGFAIRTPTAIVTDVGTEFGVEVAKTGATHTQVFRGIVQVQKATPSGQAVGPVRILHENDAAQVDCHADTPINTTRTTAESSTFVRRLPKRKIDRLDLVDVVAGGSGFGQSRNRGIDPTSGKVSRASPQTYYPTLVGDHGYHRVQGVPFVDGVFVPDGSAGAVQVDSAGHTFSDFGKTDNLTYGHIWAGGSIKIVDSPGAIRTTLLGNDDYSTAGHGVLLVHANSAMTFDLQAIRNAIGGKPIRFRAVAGNAATMAEVKAVFADFWLLVDGKPRFVRKHDAGRAAPILVSVPLGEKDRFLTLAFTDGGDGCGWDWTMLGDPQLDIVVTQAKHTSP